MIGDDNCKPLMRDLSYVLCDFCSYFLIPWSRKGKIKFFCIYDFDTLFICVNLVFNLLICNFILSLNSWLFTLSRSGNYQLAIFFQVFGENVDKWPIKLEPSLVFRRSIVTKVDLFWNVHFIWHQKFNNVKIQ